MSRTSLNISLTGANSANKKLEVSANNTANISSKSFKKSRTENIEIPNGGTATKVSIGEQGTDLVADSITRIESAAELSSNINVIKTADEMLGTVINIKT